MKALRKVEEGLEDTTVKIPEWVSRALADKTQLRKFWITKGLGSGGTFGAAIWHYLLCQVNHRSPFSWAIAPTFTQVRDTLIPTFSEVFRNYFLLEDGRDYRIITGSQPHIELFEHGQTIWFRSANRPDTFVGPSISHFTFSEPGLCERLAFQKCIQRHRCPKAFRLQCVFEGTPEGQDGFYAEEADFPEGVDQARNACRIIVPTRANRYLPDGYIGNLERVYQSDPNKLKSYTEGVFTSFTKGSAYWDFHESRNVVLGVEPSQYLPLIFCWDFNKSPMSWVVMQRQPNEKHGYRYHRFVALAESEGSARGIMDACVEFIQKFPPAQWKEVRIEVDGDPSGYAGGHLSQSCGYDQILQALRGRYSNVVVTASRKAPSVQARLERVNQCFAYGYYVASAWCRNLIRSHKLSNLKKGMWELEKPPDSDPTHYADATGYPIFSRTKSEDFEMPNRRKVYGMNV